MVTTVTRSVGLALLSTLTLCGVLEAQTPSGTERSGYCSAGPMTLVGGQVAFHVSLDDRTGGPAGFVRMRLIDRKGVVVASRNVWLQPGHSTTLVYTGTGLIRPQAETFESLSTIGGLSDRRKVVGTIELFDDVRAVLPVLCAEPADQGRIPG